MGDCGDVLTWDSAATLGTKHCMGVSSEDGQQCPWRNVLCGVGKVNGSTKCWPKGTTTVEIGFASEKEKLVEREEEFQSSNQSASSK
ncbi:hypothetical protein Ahy_Scaffold7g108284 isoform D [Arachis hypogaea]|uniref:Uncharacterized protein n=1 Tax=Arachis hypogaea TaxID=3818 RepID=A0A444WNI9_ARAHY|nr:hypothetical protein Ahy_Scaffold7g108284 isoform D [Arachis hypogaea]